MKQIAKEVDARATPGFPGALLHPEFRLIGILFPATGRAQMLNTTTWVGRDLALTALALREAKAKNGSFPARLEDLAASGFTPPNDRFSDQPLVYRRVDDGYILFSVGENQKDDNGVSRDELKGSISRNYDIVVKASH